DAQQPLALLLEQFIELTLVGGDIFLARLETALEVIQVALLDGEGIELAVERVLAVGQALFELLELGTGVGGFLLEFTAELLLLFLGGQFNFLGLVAGFLGCAVDDLTGLITCPGNEAARGVSEVRSRPRAAQHEAHEGANEEVFHDGISLARESGHGQETEAREARIAASCGRRPARDRLFQGGSIGPRDVRWATACAQRPFTRPRDRGRPTAGQWEREGLGSGDRPAIAVGDRRSMRATAQGWVRVGAG